MYDGMVFFDKSMKKIYSTNENKNIFILCKLEYGRVTADKEFTVFFNTANLFLKMFENSPEKYIKSTIIYREVSWNALFNWILRDNGVVNARYRESESTRNLIIVDL